LFVKVPVARIVNRLPAGGPAQPLPLWPTARRTLRRPVVSASAGKPSHPIGPEN